MRAVTLAAVAALACSGVEEVRAPIVTASADYIPAEPAQTYMVGAVGPDGVEHRSAPVILPDAGCPRYVSWGEVPGAVEYRIWRQGLDYWQWGVIGTAPAGVSSFVDDQCHGDGV